MDTHLHSHRLNTHNDLIRPIPSLFSFKFSHFYGYFSMYLVKRFRFELFLFLVKAHVNLG